MITLETICREVPGATPEVVQRFVAEGWVRPERRGGDFVFGAIDLARVRLIVELRGALAVEDGTLPVVLSLLDQLHATRRQLRRVLAAVGPEARGPLLEGWLEE